MARELSEIKAFMTSQWMANDTIKEKYSLTPGNSFDQEFSKVSIENILFDIVAFAIYAIERIHDIFKSENEAEMARQKIHSKQWYRQKALDFQYGFSVIPGTDKFDNTGKTEAEIQSSKIIAQAACIKFISTSGFGILRIKVAKAGGSGLIRLSEEELTAIRFYFLRYATDAGTQLKVTTGNADKLKLSLDVYYDPLVLAPNGSRLDGTSNTPVVDAVNKFLRSLEFNGALIISDLQDYLRSVDGVVIARVKSSASKYGDYEYTSQNVPQVGEIDEIRVADSGYMELDIDELQINYKVMED